MDATVTAIIARVVRHVQNFILTVCAVAESAWLCQESRVTINGMASKATVIIEDDLDGSEADETLTFGLDGRSYEIDLSEKNAAKLRKVMAQYVAAGRPAGRIPHQRRSTGGSDGNAAVIRDYNHHRPHQSRQQRPPDTTTLPVRPVADLDAQRTRRHSVLGSPVNEYHHVA
jgi:hypothetical protein